MLFVEEVPDDTRLLLATSAMRSGIRAQLRPISRSWPPHGLLGVLVEQLIWIGIRAVAWHEANQDIGIEAA
jgi:hypothetical protein